MSTMLVQGLRQLADAASSITQGSSLKDPSTAAILFMACLCAVLPFDISQMSFALVGAVFYALLQKRDEFAPKKQPSPSVNNRTQYNAVARSAKVKSLPLRKDTLVDASSRRPLVQTPQIPDVRKVSVQPVTAPTFHSTCWEGEVQELLVEITPTAEVHDIVKQMALKMTLALKAAFPEIEVAAFASGNFNCGKAFGVACPEVDMVASVSPQIFLSRLCSQSKQSASDSVDPRKLQKTALRVCTDRLAAAGFKFRRSAFKAKEPKVTLLAPASLGLFAEPIPVHFSINVLTPLYNAALLAECEEIDTRAKDLILLVKRWAKDRGICHTPKGHLSPYMWGLLSIYFLQVRQNGEGPVLPPFQEFEISFGLDARRSRTTADNATPLSRKEPTTSVGALFKEFVHFFEKFEWQTEAVSFRSGQASPPGLELPLHASSLSREGPLIEDPFHVTQNLGDAMTSASFLRLKEELSRAQQLCVSGASLSQLLEPWAPDGPEMVESPDSHD